MRQKSGTAKTPSEQIVRDIRRATHRFICYSFQPALICNVALTNMRVLRSPIIADITCRSPAAWVHFEAR
jgi:hypothetical protein